MKFQLKKYPFKHKNMTNWLDESKENIIKEFFERKDDKDFKWFKIQAWPWTWKTYLLKKVISRLSEELKDQNIFALSFSNSAIDTISTKLEKDNNIKIKTIASFFIENFIIPFSYTILKNEQIDQFQKELLEKVSNSFSENSITSSNEWKIMNWIIKKYCNEGYFELFHNIIIQNRIKFIFIDEYQDTQDYCIDIFNKIIKKWEIKFFCLWDKNQQINFEKDNNAFAELEEKKLETTYRFWENILDYTNKVLDSWIINCDESCNDWTIKSVSCSGFTKLHNNEIPNLINFIIEWITSKKELFIWKTNVILFQPATDYGFWDEFNKKLEVLLRSNNTIVFSYTEKPVYNIHLKLFFEKVIAFVNWDESIIYFEIEKELDFFYEKWEQKLNFKRIFSEILKFKNIDEINGIWNLLQEDWFKKWWRYKEYYIEISKLLKKWTITFLQAKNKNLIDLIDLRNDEKIYISTNTITSSKWKEYDNVIILWVYNIQWQWIQLFSEILKTSEEAKRHYYVAVSRAKENVFTFVNY